LAVLAFAVLGLLWIVGAVRGLPILIENSAEGFLVTSVSIGLMLLAGILVFVFRTGLARWLFDADDEPIGTISAVDAQVVGLILFGVWILCHQIPTMIIEAAREQSKMSTAGFMAVAGHVALGCVMVFRPGWIARLWCKDA
jgi:hypothetical protein